jgi:hypothetical protein
MNINEMTTDEKNRHLALLAGDGREFYDKRYTPGMPGEWYAPLNLYDTGNMALAWEVKRWFTVFIENEKVESIKNNECRHLFWDSWHWWKTTLSIDGAGSGMDFLIAAEAQAAWLDKILELAIEAGMVKE